MTTIKELCSKGDADAIKSVMFRTLVDKSSLSQREKDIILHCEGWNVEAEYTEEEKREAYKALCRS